MGCQKSLEERHYVLSSGDNQKAATSPLLKAMEVLPTNTVGTRRETMSKISFLWLEQRHTMAIFREEETNGSHFSVWFELVIV